jgi:hypothetical protein
MRWSRRRWTPYPSKLSFVKCEWRTRHAAVAAVRRSTAKPTNAPSSRIQDWLKTKNIDPMTGDTLRVKALFPDEDMKQRCSA